MLLRELIENKIEDYPQWFTWLKNYEKRWRVDPEYSMLHQLGLDNQSVKREDVLAITPSDIKDALTELGKRYRKLALKARFDLMLQFKQAVVLNQLGHMQRGLNRKFDQNYDNINEARNPFKIPGLVRRVKNSLLKDRFTVVDDFGNARTVSDKTAKKLKSIPNAEDILEVVLTIVNSKGSDLSQLDRYNYGQEALDIIDDQTEIGLGDQIHDVVQIALEELFEL